MKVTQQMLMMLACLLLPAVGRTAESGVKPDPVLQSVRERLQQGLGEFQPSPRFEFPVGHGGRTLIVRYRTREYLVYPRNKAGRLDHYLVKQEGPDDEGVLLKIHLQKAGEVNQAVVPQTIREPYWQTLLEVHAVADSDWQLFVAASYRGSKDQALLKAIRALLGGGR